MLIPFHCTTVKLDLGYSLSQSTNPEVKANRRKKMAVNRLVKIRRFREIYSTGKETFVRQNVYILSKSMKEIEDWGT
ncbi:hypothetical protein C0J52_09352 [Blattella germanica]|nr:hypothetical protein C0J52_09352 [Blattella germanica]